MRSKECNQLKKEIKDSIKAKDGKADILKESLAMSKKQLKDQEEQFTTTKNAYEACLQRIGN
jgi:seryl-tRNA synthetase